MTSTRDLIKEARNAAVECESVGWADVGKDQQLFAAARIIGRLCDALEEATAWKPIDDAAKVIERCDGKHGYGRWLLGVDRWGNRQEMQWWRYENDPACNFLGRDGNAFRPVAYMPLPAPPLTEGEGS